MSGSKKNPPVMSFETAERIRDVKRRATLRAQAAMAEAEAKKAKKKPAVRPVMLFTGARGKRIEAGKAEAKTGITGRDDYILSEALATAITALSRLKHPPESNIADMKAILADW